MTVARLHEIGDLRIGEEPVPRAGPGQALLSVSSVGLCGSDRHWFADGGIGRTALTEPLVLGHEFAGVIADGAGAGRRVVADPAIPCGACRTCTGGQPELCPTAGFAGYAGTDGALRTHATWPIALLRDVPAAISDDEASMLEPLGVAIHAAHLAAPAPGMSVAVIGAGPIGQLVVRVLVARGDRDVCVGEPLPHRLDAAISAGARPLTDDDDVDTVIECAGTDAAVATAVERVRPGGRVVLVGIPGDDRTTFTASVARRKGLTIQLCRRMRPADLDRAIEMVGAGAVSLAGLVTHTFPLADIADAFRTLMARGGIKIVVRP